MIFCFLSLAPLKQPQDMTITSARLIVAYPSNSGPCEPRRVLISAPLSPPDLLEISKMSRQEKINDYMIIGKLEHPRLVSLLLSHRQLLKLTFGRPNSSNWKSWTEHYHVSTFVSLVVPFYQMSVECHQLKMRHSNFLAQGLSSLPSSFDSVSQKRNKDLNNCIFFLWLKGFVSIDSARFPNTVVVSTETYSRMASIRKQSSYGPRNSPAQTNH